MSRRALRSARLWICLVLGLGAAAHAEEPSRVQAAGEAFGKLVRAEEFAYHYKTAAFFTRTGNADRKEADIREEAWQNLLFLREADRLGIEAGRGELEEELKRLVADKHVRYGSPEYAQLIASTLKEDVPLFERRIGDLLRINKLIKLKADPDVVVTEEEMQQKFLNQYNSFESEYIHVGSRQEAEEFVARVQQTPALWKETFDRKKAEEGQKGAAWINVMALEALMDLWKIPKEDAYRIVGAEEGSILVSKNFYGDAAVRLLFKQPATLEQFDEKQKTSYRGLLTKVKKQQAAKAYFDDLLARAQVRDYEQERQQTEQRKQQEATVPMLKEKSRILFRTTQGDVELQLWPEVAPKACENFIGLVEKGYYDGLIFHRVIKEFMIQGGDPAGNGTGGESIWGKPFEDEIREDVTFNRPGLLAMANSGPNTNGSQFFITTVPTTWLNGKHTVFGEVASGLDVVKRIEGVPTGSGAKPLEAQKILKASVEPQKTSPGP